MDTRNIMCPLTESNIDEYTCYLICEAAEGMLPENEMPGRQGFETERKICLDCPNHDAN